MKIAFSSLACPSWDLKTIIDNASSMGFDGVELRGLQGELHLPHSKELAGPRGNVRSKFADHKIELVCLSTSATLSSKNRRELAEQKDMVVEYIELADRLGCPYVRLFAGEVGRLDNKRAALGRVAQALASLVPVANRAGVTILVENGGDFLSSNDMWFLADAANHPAVKICWNQCTGMMNLERPTISIPRLGTRIGMIHVCDADFAEDGTLLKYRTLGEGHVEIARQIELLRGLAYDRYLVFEWPKLWQESLPNAASTLPQVATWLKEQISTKQNILSAYKADKRKPKFASPPIKI